MKLGALLQDIPILEKIHWDPSRSIKKITCDSRNIDPGDLFIACSGSRMDGHDFLGQAIVAKAAAVIYQHPVDLFFPARVAAVRVEDSQACLSLLLNRFYQHPDRKVKICGVTGTNGKTTIAYLLHQMLREKTPAAYLGTLWYDLPGHKLSAPNTTPGPEVLIPLLKEMVHEKVQYCVMEVSSHALDQRRTFGLEFELAMFTQLTQDHLDYHKDMEGYFQAKRLFFSNKPEPRQMLINADCLFGKRLLSENPKAKSYSLDGPADYRALELEPSFQGSRFVFEFKGRKLPCQIRLPMRHNVANVLCVLSGLDLLGLDPQKYLSLLAEIPGIPGRLERVPGTGDFQVFVDYAHTPDAIENVLREAQKLKPNRVLTLFGCGGDRDRSKRPLMAHAACLYSDVVVLTSDNPRSEDPEMILSDIKKGLPKESEHRARIIEIPDRAQAIETIVSMAEPGDAVFLLGKGHEDYQIIGDRKIPFDDRLVVQETLTRKTRAIF